MKRLALLLVCLFVLTGCGVQYVGFQEGDFYAEYPKWGTRATNQLAQAIHVGNLHCDVQIRRDNVNAGIGFENTANFIIGIFEKSPGFNLIEKDVGSSSADVQYSVMINNKPYMAYTHTIACGDKAYTSSIVCLSGKEGQYTDVKNHMFSSMKC